mmetsp:Transcript_43102/g.133384  ORF Transcript_43102/g.133384 Transcript_43102/m.133384 type:complete len:91 (-) Transcript_43102:623-895(-)
MRRATGGAGGQHRASQRADAGIREKRCTGAPWMWMGRRKGNDWRTKAVLAKVIPGMPPRSTCWMLREGVRHITSDEKAAGPAHAVQDPKL